MFKHGIQPTWEDPENQRGGKWVLVCKQQWRGPRLDSMWQGLVLALIGNAFDDEGDVSGVVISIRAKGGDKISIWTKTCDNEEKCLRIGQQFLKSMEMDGASIGYQIHSDALAASTSFRNQNKYKIN